MKRLVSIIALSLISILLPATGFAQSHPVPVITGFSPAVAGQNYTVTISGANFSSTPSENILFFGGIRSLVTASSVGSLSAIVPAGATYAPIHVESIYHEASTSELSFLPVFSGGDLDATSFTSQTLDNGVQIGAFAVGDIDGDSKPDIIVGNYNGVGNFGDWYLRVYPNTSSGSSVSIGSAVNIPSLAGISKVYLEDMNGDGKLDVVTVNAKEPTNQISIFLNTSTPGNISFSRTDFSANISNTFQVSDLAIGDIDGDGFPDMVVIYSSEYIRVYKNSENFSWGGTPFQDQTLGFPTGVVIGDFNGDGKPDIAMSITNSGTDYVRLYQNNSTPGTIALTNVPTLHSGGTQPEHLYRGDFDGDGRMDLLVMEGATGSVYFYRKNATAFGFDAPVAVNGFNWTYAALGDVDGDGKVDVVLPDPNTGSVRVLKNNSTSGSISFTSGPAYSTGDGPNQVIAADLNGDGKPEILVQHYFGSVNTLTILQNNLLPYSLSKSSVSLSANTIMSDSSVTATLLLKTNTGAVGTLGNPSVTFGLDGSGTSTGTFGPVTGDGFGTYHATFRGVTVGTANAITATIAGQAITSVLPTITVVPGVASTVQSIITASASNVVKNGSVSITLQAKDVNGNSLTAGGLTVAFGLGGSGTSNGTFSPVIDFGNGLYTAVFTGTTAGTARTFTATVGGNPLTGPAPTIIVEPNTPYPANCSITVSPSTFQSGTSTTVTMTTRNINGTPLIAGGHTVSFSLKGTGTSSGTISPVFDNNDGTYSATLTGTTSGTTNSVGGTVDTSTLTNLSGNTFTVTPGVFSLTASTATVTPNPVPSGTTSIITFRSKDAAGNNVPETDLNVVFALQINGVGNGGTSTGQVGPVINNNDGSYTATLKGITAGTPTGLLVTATGPGIGGNKSNGLPLVTVVPGAVSTLQSVLNISQPTLPSGLSAVITLQAKDSVGNLQTSGGLSVSFFLSGGGTSSGSIGNVTDNGNGTYTALFTGSVVGTARTISAVVNGNALASALPTITVTIGPPTITTMTPESDTVGGSIVLQGTNFDATPANDAVYFGTTRGTVTSASAISLTVSVPPASVRGNVTVINLASHLSGTSAHAFQPTFKAGAFIDQNALAPMTSFASGNNTNGVATGDLDGDGKPDIIVANESAGTLTFYRNTGSAGSPSFVLTGTTGAGFDPQSIRLADLDGDGKLDIVVTGVSSFYVSALRNTSTPGSISFASAQAFPLRTDNTGGGVEDGVNSLVLADFNGDGKIDAATLDGSNLNAIVFLNSSVVGSISFAPHFDIPVGSYVHGIGAGDLDGDGRPELLVTFDNNSKMTVFRNTSSAGVLSFASGQDFASGQYTYGITVGDVDGDGNADVLTANRAGSVSIFRNISSLGTIAFASRQDLQTPDGSAKIVLTDMDGDGKPDLAVTNENSGTVSLLKNGSTPGTLAFSTAVSTTIGQLTTDLAVADLDGDGKPDLAVSNATAHSFSLLRNTVPLFSPLQSVVTLTAGTVASGTSITATLHLKDPSGTAVAVTGKTVVFSLTGNGTSAGTFGTTTDNGDGTYSAIFTGTTTGTARNVTSSINGTPLTSALPTVTVTPGTFSANTSALSAPYTYGGPNPLLVVSAGDSAAITLQAKDALGNNLTTGGLTVTMFRRGSGTSTGSFGVVSDLGNGTYTAQFTGAIAGTSDSIGAVINGDTVATRKVQYQVQFGAVSPSHCILAVSSDSVQAGQHATISLSVRDAFGNLVTTSQQSIQFALGSGTSFGIINLPDGGWAQLAGPGLFDGDFYGMNAGTPVTITGTINGSPITSTLPAIKVVSGQFSSQNSWAEVSSTLVASGDSTTLILHAYDTYNNPHTQGNLNVVFAIQGSGTSTGTIRSAHYAGNGNYTDTFIGGHAGNLTYIVPTVNGNGLQTVPPYVVVEPGNYSPAASTLTVDKAVIQSGSSAVLTFQAKDAGGDNLSSGGLTVLMSMAHAGTSAGVLGNVADLQNGQYQAYFQGTTAGTADTVHVTVNGVPLSISLPTITVVPGVVDPAKSLVTLSPSTIRVGATSTVTFQAKDASGNALTSGGLTVSFSLESFAWSGTSSGAFSAVTDHNNGTYTATFTGTLAGTPRIVVTSTNVTPINASPALTVFGGPIISSFSPTSGNAGTMVTIQGSNFNSTLANNIVYFGATRAALTGGSTSSLQVTVPQGATYAPITVADSTRQAVAVSAHPFLPTFSGGDVFSSSSMNAKVDFPVGLNPTSIATADFDGDGKPDLVVTNASSNTITIYRNTGTSGTIAFSARLDSAAGSSPRSVAVADLDADGRPDIAVLDSTSGNVTIYRNTSVSGTISFAGRVSFPTSPSPVALALADLDGDGGIDVIVGYTNGITVYRSTGSLSYASSAALSVTSSLSALTAVDLNDDGKPEILATSTGSNLLTVFHNTSTPGSVSFDAGAGTSTGSNPASVAAADLNNDGKLDVIVANGGGTTISYFQNTSSGGSVSLNPKSDVNLGISPNSVAVGEMNGDGKPDVVVASSGSNSVLVLLNIGSNSFNLAPPATFTTGSSPRGIVVADFDGDGRSDLALAESVGDSISVLKSKIDQFSLTRSTVSLSASTVASGSSVVATLQTKDINGVNLTTGGATVAFFISGSGTSTVTFSSVHDNSNGTYTDTLKGIVAGTADSIGASVNGAIVNSLLPTLQVTGGTAVAATSTVSIQSNVTLGQTAGATLVAYDVNSNRVTSGGATVVFSLTGGGTSAGTFSATTDHGDGTYTSTFTATGLGSARTVSATLNGITVGTSLPTVTVSISPPTITAISATSGKTGSSAILTGTNFNPTASADTVYFGAAKATVTNATSTTLTVTVPLGAAYGPITLTTNGYVVQSRQFFNKTFASANGTISFGTDSIENIGNGPHGIVVADFNGDGKADFAIANFNNSTVNVMLGNGNGTFTAGGTITTGSGSDGTNYLVAADFNGDGKVDIAAGNLGNSNVVVAFGNGDGTFGSPIAPGVGYRPIGITSADLNNDGLPDIIVTSPYTTGFGPANAVTPLLNFGGNSFSAIPSNSTGAFPQGIAAGDFNNDGIPDVAVANSNDGSITICLGVGNGTFNSTSSLSTGGGFVAIGDFNNDGKLDLVAAGGSTPNVNVFLGNGDGTFGGGSSVYSGSGFYQLAVADFNGDGKLDIAVVQQGSSNVVILPGNGNGTFGSAVTAAAGPSPWGIGVADFNGDGKPDLIVANYGGGVSYIPNTTTSAAAFSDQPSSLAFGSLGVFSTTIDTVSVSNNSLSTMTISSVTSSSGEFTVSPTSGSIPALSSKQFFVTFQPTSAGAKSANIIFTHNLAGSPDTLKATATTSIVRPLITSFSPKSSAIGSSVTIQGSYFNPTAASDLVYFGGVKATVTQASTSQLTVTVPNGVSRERLFITVNSLTSMSSDYFNTKSAVSSPGVSFSSSSITTSLPSNLSYGSAVGDLNNDGKLDLVVAGSSDSSIAVLLGNGNGTFGAPSIIKLTGATYKVAVADMDGDGKVDIIATSGTNVAILRGNGNGTFNTPSYQLAGNTQVGIAIADFNNDGKLDVAVACSGDSRVSVMLGNGDGTLGSRLQLNSGSTPQDVAAADFNGDGKMDIAVTGYVDGNGGHTPPVFLGNGNGTFGGVQSTGTGFYFGNGQALVVGDLNGDGTTDLIEVAGYGGFYTTVVYLGNNSVPLTVFSYVQIPDPATGIVAADFNGDGTPDVGAIQEVAGGGALTALLGPPGYGAYASSGTIGTVPGGRGLSVGDFNNDGKVDVIATTYAGSASHSAMLFLNNVALPVGSPVLTSPANHAIGISVAPTLSWNSVSGATGYTVDVATDSAFQSIVFSSGNIVATSVGASNLTASTTYYWRVTPIGLGGTSGTPTKASFTTKIASPVAISPAAGTGLTLDGTNSYVSVPDQPALRLTDSLTLEAWIYPTRNSNDAIIDKGNYNYLFEVFPNGNTGLGLYNAAWGWINSTGTVPLGQWSHVAVVFQTGTNNVKFYLNGSLLSQATAPGPLTTNNGEFNIGRQAPGSCNCNLFQGTIDEVRVWNKPLTQSQIQATMNVSVAGQSGLVAYYPMDEGSGTTTADASGNGNTGTLVNGPVWTAVDTGVVTYQPTTVTFKWNPVPHADSYGLQASTVNTFSTTIVNQKNIGTASYSASGLSLNTQYYWRVNAARSGDTSDYSAAVSFSTTPPAPVSAPTLSSPSTYATNQPLNDTLTWASVSGATSYRLQVTTDSTFALVTLDQSGILFTSLAPAGLLPNTKYFWRVGAINGGGNGPFSSFRSFTTVPAVPVTPALISPLANATNQPTSLTFSWNSVSGATLYNIQVSTDTTFASVNVQRDSLAGIQDTLSGLLNNTKYFWRVRGRNLAGAGLFSAIAQFTTIATTPFAPVLALPTNGASGQSLTPTLSWHPSVGATSYALQLSADSTFGSVLVSATSVTDTTFAVQGLAQNTKYFWRVNAKNAAGSGAYGTVQKFVTIQAPLTAPALALPLNASIDLPLVDTLRWNKVTGASSYRVELAVNNAFSPVLKDTSGVVDSTFILGGLSTNTTYYWRVSTTNAQGTGSPSAIRSFTTVPSVPLAPTLLLPSNGSINLPTTVAFSWNSVLRAISYHLSISADSTFATSLVDQASLTDTTYSANSFVLGTKYFWRVSVTNAGGISPFAIRSFTTLPPVPAIPSLLSPTGGSVNQTTTLTLSWNASAGATTYRLQVSQDSLFGTSVVDTIGISATSYQFGGLGTSTLYFWRVEALNAGGTSAFSPFSRFTTILAAPVIPVLALPSTGATNQSLNPVLSWNTVPGAMSYHLQVSTDSTFGSTVLDKNGIVAASQVDSGLAPSTLYYWHVSATNIGGTSAYSSLNHFTTVPPVPLAAVLATPADFALNQPKNSIFTWNALTGATTYRIQISTDSLFGSTFIDSAGIAGFSYSAVNLADSTTYFWRIAGANVGGAGVFSVARRFKTVPPIPLAPTLLSPTNMAANQPTGMILTWSPISGAQSYHLQVSTNNAFTTFFADSSNLTGTIYVLSKLSPDSVYYWRVNATNIGGTSAYSPVRNFTIAPTIPGIPTVIGPTDGAINQPLVAVLSWNASLGARKYRIQIGGDNTFTSPLVDTTINDSTKFLVPGLSRSSRYYWRVSAINAGGASTYSTALSFSTVPPIPAIPVLATPVDSAINQPLATALRWNTSPGAVSYLVQVSVDSTFGTTLINQSGVVDTSLALSTLSNLTTYFWRVDATNPGGTSAFSAFRRFKTIIQIPGAPQLASPFNGSNNVPLRDTLSWTAAPTANSYRVQVSTDSTFASATVDQSGIVTTNFTVDSLARATKYFWRISGSNVGGAGPFSAPFMFVTIPFVPAVPTATAPIDRAINVATGVRLQWNSVTGASFYGIQVATDSAFASMTTAQDSLLSTSDSLSGLARNRTYFWHVHAGNAGGISSYSPVSRFTTIPNPPSVPLLASPADSAKNQPTTIALTWDSTAGASFYRLQVATDSIFGALVVNVDSLSTRSHTISGLTYLTTYFWRVSASNPGGSSAFSTARRFKTVPAPPGAPTLATPADSGVNVPVTLTLSWNATSGADFYRLQVARDTNFTSIAADIDSIAGTSRQVSGLINATTYFWHVRGTNAGGSSPYSLRRRFATIPLAPPTPILASPADSAVNQPTTITLKWDTATGAVTYHIQVATDSSFAALVANPDTIRVTSLTVSRLALDTRYFWRVNATNAGGTSTYSKRESFLTMVSTGVDVLAVGVPRVFALHQNYPNPFNPSTKLEFSLAKDGTVSLKVYDILGREVATIYDGEGHAGRMYRATFIGSRYASGVYFAVLRSGGKVLLKKMLMLK